MIPPYEMSSPRPEVMCMGRLRQSGLPEALLFRRPRHQAGWISAVVCEADRRFQRCPISDWFVKSCIEVSPCP